MIPVARPLLKWAGGKAQLLDALAGYLPDRPYRYVEPMIGGGALFFALAPDRALIADINPELINFYRAIVADLDGVIAAYEAWPFAEDTFYELRALSFENLDATTAAARLLYLNRACFNGLYRVNRTGGFNVPWGRYAKGYVVERERFVAARAALSRAQIELGDFRDVLTAEARAGDFVFLDPPYVPVAKYADFKRYTRAQFHDPDHVAMAALAVTLAERGCDVVITNSNHPLVHDLYRGYDPRVLPTRRNVNAQGSGRRGEDVIIHVPAAS
ncbi:MAG: Dam family site-specific DNA-(adenine-N6)-methyltransferase [Pseudomonadota bacterium]